MDAGLAALAGAAIGAFAGMFGPLYSARQDRRERDEVRRRAVQGAARAWRDDFFSFQTFIADVFAARERGHRAPPAPHPFATDAHLIVIAENVPQRRAWTRVVASRASLHQAQADPETMPDSDLARAFVELDKGRAALARFDRNWADHERHPQWTVVAPHLPPGTKWEDRYGSSDEF